MPLLRIPRMRKRVKQVLTFDKHYNLLVRKFVWLYRQHIDDECNFSFLQINRWNLRKTFKFSFFNFYQKFFSKKSKIFLNLDCDNSFFFSLSSLFTRKNGRDWKYKNRKYKKWIDFFFFEKTATKLFNEKRLKQYMYKDSEVDNLNQKIEKLKFFNKIFHFAKPILSHRYLSLLKRTRAFLIWNYRGVREYKLLQNPANFYRIQMPFNFSFSLSILTNDILTKTLPKHLLNNGFNFMNLYIDDLKYRRHFLKFYFSKMLDDSFFFEELCLNLLGFDAFDSSTFFFEYWRIWDLECEDGYIPRKFNRSCFLENTKKYHPFVWQKKQKVLFLFEIFRFWYQLEERFLNKKGYATARFMAKLADVFYPTGLYYPSRKHGWKYHIEYFLYDIPSYELIIDYLPDAVELWGEEEEPYYSILYSWGKNRWNLYWAGRRKLPNTVPGFYFNFVADFCFCDKPKRLKRWFKENFNNESSSKKSSIKYNL